MAGGSLALGDPPVAGGSLGLQNRSKTLAGTPRWPGDSPALGNPPAPGDPGPPPRSESSQHQLFAHSVYIVRQASVAKAAVDMTRLAKEFVKKAITEGDLYVQRDMILKTLKARPATVSSDPGYSSQRPGDAWAITWSEPKKTKMVA